MWHIFWKQELSHRASSHFYSWYDIENELEMGVITVMGLIQISDLQDYWSADIL